MGQLAHLGFKRYPPAKSLSPWIDWFWQINCVSDNQSQTDFMHPDGGSGLIFNFADPLHFNRVNRSETALINGPALNSTRFNVSGYVDALGIRFKPGALSALVNAPVSELKNECLSVNNPCVSPIFIHWAEQLAELKTTQARIRWVEKRLLPLFNQESANLGRISPAIALICRSSGDLELAELLPEVNLSQRQFERLCLYQLGMTAKKFCRIRRTIQARHLLKTQPVAFNIADIAYQLGYFDQAHFTHEFKQIIGITPGQFRNKALNSSLALTHQI